MCLFSPHYDPEAYISMQTDARGLLLLLQPLCWVLNVKIHVYPGVDGICCSKCVTGVCK